MFKYLFGKVSKAQAETQRQTVERALAEINAIVAELEVKPRLTFDPSTGALELGLPEQMPDEALALPAPEAVQGEVDAADDVEEKAA